MALEDLHVPFDHRKYSRFLCTKLSMISEELSHGCYREWQFLEFDALDPMEDFEDGTTKWWHEDDLESRKNAMCICIALAELNIPLP
jgi:hypothetical protein